MLKRLLFYLFLLATPAGFSQNYTIVIHGGAGNISASMPENLQQAYQTTLDSALIIGAGIMNNNGSALDAVEKVFAYLEDCPLYNAGRGAVFTYEGKNELDASIMDGRNLMAGAVAGVSKIKHPISAARKVMEVSPHVMLSGEGADDFAREQGLELVDNSYFSTHRRFEQFEKAKEKYLQDKMGTVGCVVYDGKGNLAAGTSTGGMTLKRWGRIGDSPIIGAGTYADNQSCAVSCTGHGEYFIRLGVARDVAARMKYLHLTLEEAAADVMQELSQMGGTGGFIAVDCHGHPVMLFNTSAMFRAYTKGNGEKMVEIF